MLAKEGFPFKSQKEDGTYLATLRHVKGCAKGQVANGVGCEEEPPLVNVNGTASLELLGHLGDGQVDTVVDLANVRLEGCLGHGTGQHAAVSAVGVDVAGVEHAVGSAGRELAVGGGLDESLSHGVDNLDVVNLVDGDLIGGDADNGAVLFVEVVRVERALAGHEVGLLGDKGPVGPPWAGEPRDGLAVGAVDDLATC